VTSTLHQGKITKELRPLLKQFLTAIEEE
jgi:hypothetical protein